MSTDSRNIDTLLVKNKVYKRSIIHDSFGGGRQGGISPSASYPYIFIFSGSTGQQHGYKDQWENEDIFSYTGEGQLFDMAFIRGNLALRDHIKNGKRVFLFTYVAKGLVKFESELTLVDFDFFEGPDKSGNKRIAIKFFFTRVRSIQDRSISQKHSFETADPEVPPEIRPPNETERQGLVTSRVGQGAYRKSILYRWNFKCAVTSYVKHEILIASHIVPWKYSTNDERLDVDNGILLSPTYDALFDKRLISFENNGKIILSKTLLETNFDSIGVTGKEKITSLTSGNLSYLERHRLSIT